MLYILSGSPRLKSRHPRMPERFWDIQHNQHFQTQVKIQANVVYPFWFTQVEVPASAYA